MHSIQLPNSIEPVRSGHLRLGGSNPRGQAIGANNRYLTLDGRPWLPVMGEFHFSRYPTAGWKEELLKMKAGGIDIAASYIFWIHHEEQEGLFDWTGQRDLRSFIELCGDCGLYAYPRIGPWAHGEARNGGFPDWLAERCGGRLRQDDPVYLRFVERFYTEIAAQLHGLLWKDGGPVVGIQLENELCDRPEHLLTLKRLALRLGLEAPLFTMTGWGPARVPPGGELLPVFGGYPDAPWDPDVSDWARAARKHYFFHLLRDDNVIGTDLLHAQADRPPLAGATLDDYPFGTCEVGGGVQVTYHRRPWIEPDDVGALALVKIGCGSNWQGYYMYHGGSNPEGRFSTQQESQATGYPNDLPVVSYDFQAPLGEFGQVSAAYHRLRPLHLLLQNFGPALAGTQPCLPDQPVSHLDDRQSLRWAVRWDGGRGFLFVNNHQRVEGLPAQPGVQFELHLPHQTLQLPSQPVTIPAGAYFAWPLFQELGAARLAYATLQPVCRVGALDDGPPCFVFFAIDGIPPELALEAAAIQSVHGAAHQQECAGALLRLTGMQPGLDCRLRLECTNGGAFKAPNPEILILTQAQAQCCYQADLWGARRVLLSSDGLSWEGDTLWVQTRTAQTSDLWVFPAPDRPLFQDGQPLEMQPDGLFMRYTCRLAGEAVLPVAVTPIAPAGPAPHTRRGGPSNYPQAPQETAFERAAAWELHLPAEAFDDPTAHEIYLDVAYTGDIARLYLGERLIADDFYFGRAWEVGLRRFLPDLLTAPLTLKILPLRQDAPVYIAPEKRPDFFGAEQVIQFNQAHLRIERRLAIHP